MLNQELGKNELNTQNNTHTKQSTLTASQLYNDLNSNTEMWNSIYGYSFYYKDDKENILGHAVCVFEYMNNFKHN